MRESEESFNRAKNRFYSVCFFHYGLTQGIEIILPSVQKELYSQISDACESASKKLDGQNRVFPLACHSSQNSKKQLNS